MAAVKGPRSRAHSGAPAKENLPKLEESLNAFRNDGFDPQSYVQSKCSLNEKVVFSSILFLLCCFILLLFCTFALLNLYVYTVEWEFF